MPMIPEVRRMGRQWQSLKQIVSAYGSTIPPEGVGRVEFEKACFARVDFESRDAILGALKAARVVFPVRDGLEWRVFGTPPNRRQFAAPIDLGVKAFVQAVAPHVERIGGLIDADQGDPASREARAMHREAAAQVAKLVTRHAARGTPLPAMRDALWRTFRPDALAILARYEGVLARGSKVEALAVPVAKAGSIPRGLEPIDRVIALAEKAGGKGVTKGELREHFPKPRPTGAQLDAWLAQACEADVLRGEAMKLGKAGRAGMRYFHYNYETPRTVGGIAVL